jgi:hypothetical protein
MFAEAEPTPASLPMGHELGQGRFVVTAVLGTGSQGETFEAVDKLEGRRVALKRFCVRGAKSWKDVELAEREARVLATLDAPGLPRYVTHFEEDGALYLAMEKIEGETFAALGRRGKLTEADVIRLLGDGAATLDVLHARLPAVIHRDIKPSNVIRNAQGRAVLVDFGSVRDGFKPQGGSTVVGTFGYMAPEQFQGRALPASDTYALAATALALLTGKEPGDLPHKGLGLDLQACLPPSTSPALRAVLGAALEPDPDLRGRHSLSELLARHGLTAQAPRSARGQASEPAPAPEAEVMFTRPWTLPAWPLLAASLLVMLWALRAVVGSTLSFALPLLLGVLSVVFGARLLKWAHASRAVGGHWQSWLRHAARRVRQARRRQRPRWRVDPNAERPDVDEAWQDLHWQWQDFERSVSQQERRKR